MSLARVLEAHRLIHFNAQSGLRHQVDAAIARAGAVADVVVELALITDLAVLAAAGLGATIVPSGVLGHLAPETSAALRAVEVDDPLAVHEISLVVDPTRLSPSARAFRQWAIDDAASARGGGVRG